MCTLNLSLWCRFWNFWSELCSDNWLLLLLAAGGALALLCNFHVGLALLRYLTGCGDACAQAAGAAGRGAQYGYGLRNGPHTWQVAANNQSPINIDSGCVEQCHFDNPLRWVGYGKLPQGIRMENTGHTLLLRAAFAREPPVLDGGDLLGCFTFHEISFRWSWYNTTGSEHTLDNRHFPLEMQCLHTDATNLNHASSRGLLVVAYMFTVAADNPFLDVIIQHLVAVQMAGQTVEIPPFPLNYLMSPFYTQFYSYHGSLTEPPCHRGAEWFINPTPLAIGERQLHEFRKLRSRTGARIARNARPVQPLCDRVVQFNQFNCLDAGVE